MHKRSYLTFTLVGTLLAAPLAAFAQSAQAPATSTPVPGAVSGMEHHRGGAMRHALAALDLSDAQKARIKDIMGAYRRSRDGASPETREQLRTQIEGVLTPDQRTRFEAALRQARTEHNDGTRVPQPTQTS